MWGPPVDAELFDAVEKNCGQDYAVSYLSKGRQKGREFEPYTHTAWERLKDNPGAMHAFAEKKYTLKKPQTWYPGRDEYGSKLPPTKF